MTENEQTRSAEARITVDATAERVWQALTDARELERWFPLDARVEPGVGGSIWMSWRNEFAGTMKILVWDPPHHLRTAWTFHEGDATGQVTDYIIEGKSGSTVVRAVTSGFPLDAGWDGWVEGTNRGWVFELRSLKHYLERHAGQPRHVVYLRRRVDLPPEAAWARLTDDREFAPWLSGGQAFDHRPARQYAAIIDQPRDGLFRASVEPGAPGTAQREIVIWLSVWGAQAERVDAIRGLWSAALERIYPGGAAP